MPEPECVNMLGQRAQQQVRIQKLSPRAQLPKRMSPHASGYDLMACVEQPLEVASGNRVLIPTGLSIEMPPGMEAQIRPRSGLAWKHGLTIVNTPGTIDADYRGEIKVALINLGQDPVVIAPQERIAQMVFCPVYDVCFEETHVSSTARGTGGFGSTGQS